MKVYLDNCCYNRPFDDQKQIRIFLETQSKLFIQNLIINKKLDLVCSYMSIFENNDNPHPKNKIALDLFNNRLNFSVIIYNTAYQGHSQRMPVAAMTTVRVRHALECFYFGIDVLNDNTPPRKPFVIRFFTFG